MNEADQTISIEVPGAELETINITLSVEEVKAIYLNRKELQGKLATTEKTLADKESSLKYSQERTEKLQTEITQAGLILTALGVPTETGEETYNRDIQLPGRIGVLVKQLLTP